MAVTIAVMRKYLIGRYSGNAWALKVMNMPDDQVTVIYFRLIEAARKKKPIIHRPTLAPKTAYTCLDCFKSFVADNPELTECRFCGGHVTTETMQEHILKEFDYENQ